MAGVTNALWSQYAAIRTRCQRSLLHGMLNLSTYRKRPRNMESTEYEDFYRYTSGRWLWAEEERLQERYRRFNVPGLKLLAARASGAQSCVSILKLAEGGFNKVFRLAMDNGSVVIARIPNPIVGLALKVVASEVATMDFARNVMDIPVPRVIAWDGGTDNSAESEYILMEEANGTQLEELWADMDLDGKFRVVDDVIAMQAKMQSVTFSRIRYGNLYFKSDTFEGCSTVEVSGSLSHTAKAYAEDRFVIGPVAEKAFWETGTLDRGPWSDAKSYLRAVSKRERSKMSSSGSPEIHQSSRDEFDILNSQQARVSLLDKFDALSPCLPPSDPSLNKATLSHWDLRAPNLFVEKDRITSLIDWQDAWVGPLFMQERRPQLVEYNGEVMLRLPDYYEAMEDKEEKAKLTDKVENSILYWYYGQETQKKNPVLQELFDLPMVRTRREVVLFASEVWDGDTIPLRECLYQLQRHWDKLNTGSPCPISFTSKEIDLHNQNSAGWNKTADFWSSLSGFVSRDGYTAIEDYEDARKMFEELREQALTHLSGRELAEFEDQSQWAKRAD